MVGRDNPHLTINRMLDAEVKMKFSLLHLEDIYLVTLMVIGAYPEIVIYFFIITTRNSWVITPITIPFLDFILIQCIQRYPFEENSNNEVDNAKKLMRNFLTSTLLEVIPMPLIYGNVRLDLRPHYDE